MTDDPFDVRFYPGYVPFDKPMIPPEFQSEPAPMFCVQFKEIWVPWVRGAIASLLYSQMWLANDSDMEQTLGEANNLLAAFSEGACVFYPQYRIDPGDACIIQVTFDGITWVPFFDARCGQVDPDLTQFIKKIPYANENEIIPVDGSIGLKIFNNGNHGFKTSSIGGIPGIFESLANNDGFHDYNLLLTSPTPRADKKGVIGIDVFGTAQFDLVNYEGATILPEIAAVGDGQDNTGRRGGLYRYLESDDTDGLYGAVQVSDGVVDFRRLAYTVELPTEGLDGAGITAVELNQIVPTATPYATLSTPSTIQDQLLSLGINRGIGIAQVAAIGLDAGSDPDIESTPNADGDLELTFGIPAGAKGDKGDTGDAGAQGENGSLDDQPPTVGEKVYRINVLADGTVLPFLLTAGMRIVAVEAKGLWGLNGINGLTGTHVHDWNGFIDSNTNLTGSLVFSTLVDEFLSEPIELSSLPYTVEEDIYVVFGELDISEIPNRRFGYLQVDVTIDSGNNPWTHHFDPTAEELGSWSKDGDGLWDEGVGWVVDPIADTDTCSITLSHNLTGAPGTSMTELLGLISVGGIDSGTVSIHIQVFDGGDVAEERFFTMPHDTGATVALITTTIVPVDVLVVVITATEGGEVQSPYLKIASLDFSGIGTDPFI